MHKILECLIANVSAAILTLAEALRTRFPLYTIMSYNVPETCFDKFALGKPKLQNDFGK